jgi:hypothetical protein
MECLIWGLKHNGMFNAHIANMEFAADDATDSDLDLPPPSCPLCAIDEVLPETASTVSSDNAYMRRILSQELVHYGIIPNDVIYTNIARCYNKHIHKQLRRSGIESQRWTLNIVRKHFDTHVTLVPRRVLGKQIQLCQRMLSSLEKEINAQFISAVGQTKSLEDAAADLHDPTADGLQICPEFVESKTIKKICDVQSKLIPLLEKYRQFQKEDQTNAGLSTLWRSVQLGETDTQEANLLLASAAAMQTASGAGDRPMASELFQ